MNKGSLRKLEQCKKIAIDLFYRLVPNAHDTGHPGTPGWGGHEEPPSREEVIIAEIRDTLISIGAAVAKEKGERNWGEIIKLSDFKTKEDLNRFLHRVGICPQCFQPWEHHCDEPFASCHCGSSEWGFQDITKEPLLIQLQYQRHQEIVKKRKEQSNDEETTTTISEGD